MSQAPEFIYTEATESAWRVRAQEEQEELLRRCLEELKKAIGDGGWKLQTRKKKLWYIEPTESHLKSLFSHLYKYFRGDKTDEDSGAHPFVHLAARALIIALVESGNVPEHASNGSNVRSWGQTLP